MKIKQQIELAKPFWPAVFIDRVVDKNLASLVVFLLNVVGFAFFAAFLLIFILKRIAVEGGEGGVLAERLVNNLSSLTPLINGLFFMLLPVLVIIFVARTFYRSYAYLDLQIAEGGNSSPCTFEAAYLLLEPPSMDPVLAMLSTPLGAVVYYRLGLSGNEVLGFLKNRKSAMSLGEIEMGDVGVITFEKLARLIILADKEFSIFLSSRKITTEDFLGAVAWVEQASNQRRNRKRWWSRSSLGRIPGIGKDWSYGETPTLWKYGIKIERTPYYLDAANILTVRKNEVEELEKILIRVRGANSIIVGETEEDTMGIVAGLNRMIATGRAMPEIEDKEIYILNHEAIISATKEKTAFESKLTHAFAEAIRAGNIILVIKDLPSFLASSTQIGADAVSILDMFFASPNIHVIATANTGSFHSSIENNQALMRHFEKILLKTVSGGGLISYLRNEALRIESETHVVFLYQAISDAAQSAERYFFGSDLEDKASDLLIEAAANARSLKTRIVTRDDIMKLVEVKTGVPRETSSESGDSKVLLNLEKTLSERIIGQKEAVRAIASAMRRARAGITNPKRPMGSFLFLGPTGVGKTETTKVLADSFFGGEGSIIRLDMSEYRTQDALDRLIGNFDLGKPGVLTSALRDRPYGVLLLDEFEKTSKEVIDLFLQVLDEGMFSDMSGRKVSARNLIIIATSNAGSDTIWRIVKDRGAGDLNKDEILKDIIDQGIFKPELLNRFDGVIVFHPLQREELTKIADIMMRKFNKRLDSKGLEIKITPELINALVEKGTDPTFGARPMNRAIQDKVETMVADKILSGLAVPGTKIVFTPEEIEAVRS